MAKSGMWLIAVIIKAKKMGYCCVIVINLAGMALSALAREAADSKSVVFGILLLYNMIHLSVPEEGWMFAAEAQDPSALSVS